MIHIDILDGTPEGKIFDEVLSGKREKINIDDVAERMNNQNLKCSCGARATFICECGCLCCDTDQCEFNCGGSVYPLSTGLSKGIKPRGVLQ
jgi:hypothetical protein